MEMSGAGKGIAGKPKTDERGLEDVERMAWGCRLGRDDHSIPRPWRDAMMRRCRRDGGKTPES